MTALGLDQRTEQAYRVALSEPSWTTDALVGSVAQQLGLTSPEARQVVDGLVRRALLRPSDEDRDARLRVVAPSVALESALSQARRLVLDQQQTVDRAAQLLLDLQDRYTSARDAYLDHTVERLTGIDAVRSRLEHLAQNAQQEVLSFLRGTQSPESMRASAPLDEAALARGVALRGIHQHSAVNDPTTMAYLRWLDDLGAEVRTVATLPLQMIIFDREIAVLPLDVEQSGAGAQLVRGSGMVTALLALFESIWASARPVGEPRRGASVELSDTEGEILRILATGATDEVVARQLGVSVRTVRRLTAALMTRYEAQSRFELGVKLGQMGWAPGGLSRRAGIG